MGKTLKPKKRKLRRIDPDSKRQTLKRERIQRVCERDARKLSPEKCTWPADELPCCYDECCLTSTQGLVRMLKKYFMSLDFISRREFLAQRLHFDNHKDVDTGTKLNTFFLEEPEILLERLTLLDGTERKLPKPEPEDLRQVCQRYLYFVLGSCRNLLYPYHAKNVNGDHSKPRERVLDCEPTRKTRAEIRDPELRVHAEKWITELLAVSMKLPNSQHEVAPYMTRKIAHSIYVRDSELHNKCPWTKGTEDDLSAEYDEINDAAAAAYWKEQVGKSKSDAGISPWRYGNHLCMKLEDLPVDHRICSYSHFCAVWRTCKSSKNLKCRRYLPFAKCDLCVEYRDADVSTRCPKKKQIIRDKHAKHIKHVRRERNVYYRNRLRAKLYPKKYLSMIVDGADQGQFALPHVTNKSHVTLKAWKLRLKVMGVKVHGRGVWAFTVATHVAQGNNVTIQALFTVLSELLQKGPLPPILNLQLDNSGKQCKGPTSYYYLCDNPDTYGTYYTHRKIRQRVLGLAGALGSFRKNLR